MKKHFRLTQAGVDELKVELSNLISDRSNIADAIKTAREFGDLSENAEYQSARADQTSAIFTPVVHGRFGDGHLAQSA